MNSKKTGLAIVGLLLIIFIASRLNITSQTNLNTIAQLSPSAEMSLSQMQEDINYLISKLKSVHPVTQAGIPQYLEQAIEAVNKQITTPLTAGDFYFKVTQIAGSLQDSHTYINCENTKQSLALNLPITWLKRSVVVTKDTDILKQGDQIIKIGNNTLPNIFDSLAHFIPAENKGWIRAKAPAELKKEVILRHLGLINLDNTVTVTYKRENQEFTANLPLISTRELAKVNNQKLENITTIFYDEMSLAVFQLNTGNYNNEFRTKLHKFFKQVAAKKIQHVAIDIRKNTEADFSVITELFSYLGFVNELKYYDSYVRYSKDAAKQKSNIAKTRGYKQYKNVLNINKHQAESLLFKGKFYILTSNHTFGTACQFAVISYDNKIATIIGEPTGNSATRYGDCLSFQLPNSGYMFTVSYKKLTRPNKNNDPATCLTPHEIVYTVAEDIKENRDAQIEALLKMITQEN
ncbi:hypothetical protein IMX26_07090 [Clostridium sp. 'deep sea']|uniref:S41 family peptidase n=1 Tax=Clostridium sp. 'deep sea' TaxID=2779445 RepID=UPI00189642E0|nr:S41 family peptidase [Clostridium sp. 'deep sea']QOR36566.1 hypothetical protein IMX26_07090 [Clostridium sp. 'deep sea']